MSLIFIALFETCCFVNFFHHSQLPQLIAGIFFFLLQVVMVCRQ